MQSSARDHLPRFFEFDRQAQNVIDLEQAPHFFGIVPKPRKNNAAAEHTCYPPLFSLLLRQSSAISGAHEGLRTEQRHFLSFLRWPLAIDDLTAGSFSRSSLLPLLEAPTPADRYARFRLFYDFCGLFLGNGRVLDLGTQYSPDGSVGQSVQYRFRPRWTFEFHRLGLLPPALRHAAQGPRGSAVAGAEHLHAGSEPRPEPVDTIDEAPSPATIPETMSLLGLQYRASDGRFQVMVRGTGFEKMVGVDASLHASQNVLLGAECYYSATAEMLNAGVGLLFSSNGIDAERHLVRELSDLIVSSGPSLGGRLDSAADGGCSSGNARPALEVPRPALTVCAYANALGSSSVSTSLLMPGIIPRFLQSLSRGEEPLSAGQEEQGESRAPARTGGSSVAGGDILVSTRFILDYANLNSSCACGAVIYPTASVQWLFKFLQVRWDSTKGLGGYIGIAPFRHLALRLGIFGPDPFSTRSTARDWLRHSRYAFGLDLTNPFSPPILASQDPQLHISA